MLRAQLSMALNERIMREVTSAKLTPQTVANKEKQKQVKQAYQAEYKTTTVYRLVKPGCFEAQQAELVLGGGDALIRPTHLSICAADQRYWSGKRDPHALAQKLPMALIHEAVGEVVEDKSGTFAPGAQVVMIPNRPSANDPDKLSKENYSRASKFCSSSMDGFMADLVAMPAERLVECNKIPAAAASMTELLSVCINALEGFEAARHIQRNSRIGIWGDGAVGFLMALVLRCTYPDARLLLFGTHKSKMAKFDFVDEKHNVRADFKEGFPSVDHAFECVGGMSGCTNAIDQIIECIMPQGVINLMGVSEEPVPINTRMVLEKGLVLSGNSRSSKQDFEKAVKLEQDEFVLCHMQSIIAEIFEVSSIADVQAAFEYDEKHPFKTIMHWNM